MDLQEEGGAGFSLALRPSSSAAAFRTALKMNLWGGAVAKEFLRKNMQEQIAIEGDTVNILKRPAGCHPAPFLLAKQKEQGTHMGDRAVDNLAPSPISLSCQKSPWGGSPV